LNGGTFQTLPFEGGKTNIFKVAFKTSKDLLKLFQVWRGRVRDKEE
jgi:hypothetical protein